MGVGFIGLGRMGEPMATRIATAGHRVFAYDILLGKRQLAIDGVSHCTSPAEVAANSDIIVTSLPGPFEVADVVSGTNGLLGSLRPSAIMIETSTISPELSRTIAADLTTHNACYLDAPVSGGVRGAQDGTLIAMIGGSLEVLERARPVISCFAKEIFHLGPVGTGNVMKLVIQSIFLSQMASFLEAVSMGEHSGIALDKLLDVVAASSAHHPAIGTRYDKLKRGDLNPMFEVASAVKDLSLSESLWRERFGPFPVLASALLDYKAAADCGFGGSDLIGIRNWIRGQGGL